MHTSAQRAHVLSLPPPVASGEFERLLERLIDARLAVRAAAAAGSGGGKTFTPRGLRVRAGMTAEQAAERGGDVCAATITRIERGEGLPKPETLDAIADALGCTRKEYREAVGLLLSARELSGETTKGE